METRSASAAGRHRYAETIGGRHYEIEVSRVARDRWRAHLVSLHGCPTALMPFYGPTPEDAAARLRGWLSKARAAIRPAS